MTDFGLDYAALAGRIRRWGLELGFQAVGFSNADLSEASPRLARWLEMGWHGEMDYMARHAALRMQPGALVPGTVSVISCRMNYVPEAVDDAPGEWAAIGTPERAYVARYARGRDYHKLMRARLAQLCERIRAVTGDFGHRVFSDSAPVMEVELAARAGLGWRGKHTLLLSREAGSWFFLGDIYCDLPLPFDTPSDEHCGSCERCIDICPTQAIRAPYQLDARRCISYLTIEHRSAIPEALRPLIGNRVYGCDDCQLVCPWNSFAQDSDEADYAVRNGLDSARLVELFGWNEAEFEARLAGSAIRRIGYERWQRNLAVGLGNALAALGDAQAAQPIRALLCARREAATPLVREHIDWALRQGAKRSD
jgi:epoxyqueuosine reductase